MSSSGTIFQKFGTHPSQQQPADAKSVAESDADEGMVTTAALNKLAKAIYQFRTSLRAIGNSERILPSEVTMRQKEQCAAVLFEAIKTFTGLTYEPPVDHSTDIKPSPITDEAFIRAYLDVTSIQTSLLSLGVSCSSPLYQMLEKALHFTVKKIDAERLSIVGAALALNQVVAEDKKVSAEEMVITQTANMPKLFAGFYHQFTATQHIQKQELLAQEFNIKMAAFYDAVAHMDSVTPKDDALIISMRKAAAAKSEVLNSLLPASEKTQQTFNSIHEHFTQAINQLMRTKQIDAIDLNYLQAEMKAFREEELKSSLREKVGNYFSSLRK